MTWPRKLTEDQWRDIAAAYQSDEMVVSIAARYGVWPSTVIWIARKFGVAEKAYRNKRQQIIRISIERPQLGPAAIARLIGANKKYVNRVRTQCGFRTLPKVKNIAHVAAPTADKGGLQANIG